MSLESLLYPDNEAGYESYLNQDNNPVYNLYMYGLWRSEHGSGYDGERQERGEMTFLSSKVDDYGHKIISDEFDKASGYDPALTAETIRVTNVWPSFVQSLYDAATLCERAVDAFDGDAGGTTGGTAGGTASMAVDPSDPTFVHPVDRAAAFWYGTSGFDDDGGAAVDAHDPGNNDALLAYYDALEGNDSTGGAAGAAPGSGSLFVWAGRMQSRFGARPPSGAPDPSAEYVNEIFAADNDDEGLIGLRTAVDRCLTPGNAPEGDMEAGRDRAREVRGRVEELAKASAVPAVQGLIYHAETVATTRREGGTPDAGTLDRLILYGLAALPQIAVCDLDAFRALYDAFVSGAKTSDAPAISSALEVLYSRLACLGLTCDMIWYSTATKDDASWPKCEREEVDEISQVRGYVGAAPDSLREYLKVDLDVRTVGTLIEMDAGDAAFDVYRYGRNVATRWLPGSPVTYVSLRDAATTEWRATNEVGQRIGAYLEGDEPGYKALRGLGDFAATTPAVRRIVFESSVVAATLHAFAADRMQAALSACDDEATGGDVGEVDPRVEWDRAVASLSGWAEASKGDSKRGFLLMGVARYLCRDATGCDPGTDFVSAANRRLVEELSRGQAAIGDVAAGVATNCGEAASAASEAEKIVVGILVDAAAYFAGLLASGSNNAETAADAYGIAKSLVPLMPSASGERAIVERNLVNLASPLSDGADVVLDALGKFARENDVDCALLTTGVCDRSGAGAAAGAGAAGGVTPPLLGGQYVPATNVDHITDLVAQLEAISAQPDKDQALASYKANPTTNSVGMSLESLAGGLFLDAGGASDPPAPIYLDAATNPLYSIYMYSFWRSRHGSGYAGAAQAREDMTFLSEKVDYYGHKIITDEFNKASGFDGPLFAETIRATNVWMSFIQSLYDAVELCDENEADVDDPAFESPVDRAAAFWTGKLDGTPLNESFEAFEVATNAALAFADSSLPGSGSLFAWSARIWDRFDVPQDYGGDDDRPFSANEKVLEGLRSLQTSMGDCLADDASDDDAEAKAAEMRVLADDVARAATVPLVQNLIHHSALVAAAKSRGETPDPNTVDYMVLYGLAALPPIAVCDKHAFHTLYDDHISNANKSFNSTTLYDSLNSLYGRLVCLGITCEMLGLAKALDENGLSHPTCQSPSADLSGYQITDPVKFGEYLKVDLDVRTVGTLIEMDAKTAAYDVYHWGRHQRDVSDALVSSPPGRYVALQDVAMAEYLDDNAVGKAIDAYFDGTAGGADRHEYRAMMGLGDFEDKTPTQRRIVFESSVVAITLHAFVVDQARRALDACAIATNARVDHWDRAFASLSGWAELTAQTDKSFLMMEVARFLCEVAGTCNEAGDSEANRRLILAFESGKAGLQTSRCDDVRARVEEVEKLVLTVLVDATAYFAGVVAADPLDAGNAADGYGLATALIPLMPAGDRNRAVLERNMGTLTSPMPDGKDVVLGALGNFARENELDCSLLTTGLCDVTSSGTGPVPAPGTAPVADEGIDEGEDTAMAPAMEDDDEVENIPCEDFSDGGIPDNPYNTTVSAPLSGGAYTPTSNVDHVTKLSWFLGKIEAAWSKDDGIKYYERSTSGVSLKCLSTAAEREDITVTNPLYVIYMYGLWVSDDGDNDSDGYSNKVFDDEPLIRYGDTIVLDEMGKSSGFDAFLTTETIRLMNVWMAMASEIYRSAEMCRDGAGGVQGFNPVDFAAALWYGDQTDPGSEAESLNAWARKAGEEFVQQSQGAAERIEVMLREIQDDFEQCKRHPENEREQMGIQMKHRADEITSWMIVPMVQRFVHHLAVKAEMIEQPKDERNYMVLYALVVLPFVSICDEDTFDDLFNALVTDVDSFQPDSFSTFLGEFQDRYACLGITCDMVGQSSSKNEYWPECKIPSADTMKIAGYTPMTGSALEVLKVDLDISTILSFIVMEAREAALDIYENGRNAQGEGNFYIALKTLGMETSHPDAAVIYQRYSGEYGVDYSAVTRNAIVGEDVFAFASPIKSSAAASVAIVGIEMHLNILNHMYEAVECDQTGLSPDGWEVHWDEAVASTVGSAEGMEEGGSSIDGYLFFQLAQEICEHFDTCDPDGQSVVNKRIMTEFTNGQEKLKNNLCAEAKESSLEIERSLQAILVDHLAYHVKFADSGGNERSCLIAYVTRNALIPLIRPINETAAITIETNIGATASSCRVDDVDAVFDALKGFVLAKGISCSMIGSSVCEGTSEGTSDSLNYETEPDMGYTPNDIQDNPNTDVDESSYLLNNEYAPLANVKQPHSISNVVAMICNAESKDVAQDTYENDDSAGITIKSMSSSAKYAMSDELQFHQYVYALQDNVDKTDGSLLFDNKPAAEYANTITSDALDANTALGCLSVKVLNIWMWIVHKLNMAVGSCKMPGPSSYGPLDEAAALWEGGLLFDLAETLGPKFGHEQIGGMTFLNRQIVDRYKSAQQIVSANQNQCDLSQVRELRIVVKEIISYMTAVLIQSLIDNMHADVGPKEKSEMVELMAFATLPHIKTCGHEDAYDTMYKILVDKFDVAKVGDVLSVFQSHYNCFGLSCSDIGVHTADANAPECSDGLDIVGYSPKNATKTNEIAKLDLDAVAIHQLMSMDKNEIAQRIYLEGHNYFDYENPTGFGFVSFHNLTQSHTIDCTQFTTYQQTQKYLGPDFANTLIIEALERRDRFAETTSKQRDLAVNVALSSLVSYMAALEAFCYSISKCKSVKSASQSAYDGGVALLVGSVEGQARGGSPHLEGRMFYSIGKRTCSHFRSCEGGDSKINAELVRAFDEGRGLIENDNCDDLTDTVASISSLLKVPLIQSLLYFSDSSISDFSENLAAGYVASMAALPIVKDIDSSKADTINSAMDLNAPTPLSADSKQSTVQTSLSAILSSPESEGVVDCELVSAGFCNLDGVNGAADDGADNEVSTPEPPPIEPEAPMPISNGLYVATNYVGDRSAIAKDIEEIEERLKVNDFSEAKHYYTKGMNSKIYNQNGIPTGEVRSISRFSTESRNTMKGDPTYNLFVYGLADDNNEFLGRPASRYADSFIEDLLYSESPEAADAMVAITIWMQVAHSLHSAYGACKQSFLADGRSLDGRFLQSDDPALRIDEAAAYWIGDNQATGSSTKGHLLYALTETMGHEFEKIPGASESTINSGIMDLLNKAKNHIAISRGCSTSEDSHLKLKGIIDELIPFMAVPLLRSLLFHLSNDNAAMVKVYAVAALPLFSACSPSTFKELKDELIDHEVIKVEKLYIYSKIQSLYSCLGLTCDMVGEMLNDIDLRCDYSADTKSLAGYRYVADEETISAASRVDVVIAKVDMFIDNGVNHFPESVETLFGTALDLYRYGEHPSNRNSLSSMARDTNRDVVPAFEAFRRYFKFDDNYADTLVTNAFQKKGVFENATIVQRKRFIAFALKYMVTYMAILEKLYDSVQSCKKDDREEGGTSIDLAAGYYIGSLEGKNDGGSFDGQLIFMLAMRMCVQFGTCTEANNARVNERIINLFYSAQGEVATGACGALARTVTKIENAMIVPLIQGVLFSARENAVTFNKGEGPEYYPEGYALSLSILPMISEANKDSARDIENVMTAFFPGLSATDIGANNYAKVHTAMQTALSEMPGIDCSQIGRLDGLSICPGDSLYDAVGSASSHFSPTLLMLVVSVFSFALL
ncbi:hypothetical protein ACHAWF_018259 [Thalassiosira exigua]